MKLIGRAEGSPGLGQYQLEGTEREALQVLFARKGWGFRSLSSAEHDQYVRAVNHLFPEIRLGRVDDGLVDFREAQVRLLQGKEVIAPIHFPLGPCTPIGWSMLRLVTDHARSHSMYATIVSPSSAYPPRNDYEPRVVDDLVKLLGKAYQPSVEGLQKVNVFDAKYLGFAEVAQSEDIVHIYRRAGNILTERTSHGGWTLDQWEMVRKQQTDRNPLVVEQAQARYRRELLDTLLDAAPAYETAKGTLP